jgi:hypothetical protein
LLPADRQQLGRQFASALARLFDFVQGFALGGRRGGLIARQRGVAQNDREQVVEVVRHATGESPDGFHLLRMAQLVLGASEVGFGVLAFREIDRKDAGPIRDRNEPQFEPPHTAIGERELVLHGVVRALGHAAAQVREHGRVLDAGEARHHRAAEQLLASASGLTSHGLVHIEVRKVESDYLAPLQQAIEHAASDRTGFDGRRLRGLRSGGGHGPLLDAGSAVAQGFRADSRSK